MSALDRRAAELRDVVQDMLKQFQSVNAAAANGPHAELNFQELRVVEFLGDEGPHMMRELAEFLNVAVNSVTTIVDNLEKKKLVRRLRSETDRRIVRVELTDAGRLIYQDALDVNMKLFRTMLGALTAEEQEVFLMLIRKIVRVGRSQINKMASSA
jgi:MarR family 2-MHQ and catechol resistance regulon transcriptional repressor